MNESPFLQFMRHIAHKKTYLETMNRGNNGDVLIVMGLKHLLRKVKCRLVARPEEAEQIIFRGSGSMNDIWPGGVRVLGEFRHRFPDLPVIVGPSTYIFREVDMRRIFQISDAPLTLFARDSISARYAREVDLPPYVDIKVSHDLAFELSDGDFLSNLLDQLEEKHVLVAMRKDIEGSAAILSRIRAMWLPLKIRRPLRRVKERLAAWISQDIIERILTDEQVSKEFPRIYRDISESATFDEFVAMICGARLIISDHLHVGILGHMLNKRVVLLPGVYHKIKGVYEASMSGPNSRTSLYMLNSSE